MSYLLTEVSLPDLTNANVSYDKVSNQVTVYKAQSSTFGYLITINDVPQVIKAKDFLKLEEMLKNIDQLPNYGKQQAANHSVATGNKDTRIRITKR